jgi:N utilization substance protein B
MPARHRSRARALQLMFLWDLRKQDIGEAISSFYDTLGSEEDDPTRTDRDEFMETLVRGAVENVASIDKVISDKSANWRIERMPAVDRNILRLAIFEMADLRTPAAVAIDEALDLARQFSGDESVAFINGVLDAVSREK